MCQSLLFNFIKTQMCVPANFTKSFTAIFLPDYFRTTASECKKKCLTILFEALLHGMQIRSD